MTEALHSIFEYIFYTLTQLNFPRLTFNHKILLTISMEMLIKNILETFSSLANCSLFFNAGLLSWNAAECHVNLVEELNTITAQALDGEEGKNGKNWTN